MEYFFNLWSSSIPGTYLRQSNFGDGSRGCPEGFGICTWRICGPSPSAAIVVIAAGVFPVTVEPDLSSFAR
jgi:hypothetical protein